MANMIPSVADRTPAQAPNADAYSTRPTLVTDTVPASLDDSGQGLALFLLFIAAVLLVTCGVAFLALLPSWWVVGFVFGLHVLVTVVVGTAVFTVLGGGAPRFTGEHRARLGHASRHEGPVQSRPASPIAA